MLRWALIFFIFSLVSAFLGFGGIAVATADIAKMLFYIFIILFIVSLVFGIVKKGDSIVKKNL